ncbi:MAG: glycosyltransferase family 39 protein [bacterium]
MGDNLIIFLARGLQRVVVFMDIKNNMGMESKAKNAPDARKQRIRYFIGILALMAVSFGLRVYRAGEPFGGYHSFNEGWYSILAGNYTDFKSLLFPTSLLGKVDYNVSPFLSYILFAISKITGPGELAYRMAPIAFSVATLPLIYAFGARFIGRFAGFAAAVLYAFMPVSVVVGRNVQTDAVYVFIMLASLMTYLGAREGGRGAALKMLAAGLLFGIAFMTKQFAVLLLPAVFIWETGRARGFRWFGVGHLIFGAGALVAPGPFFAYHLMNNAGQLAGAQHALSVSQFQLPTKTILHFLGTEYFWGFSPFLTIFALAAIAYFCVRRNEGATLAMLAALMFALFFTFWHGHSYYILFAAPFVCLLAGGALQAVPARGAMASVVIALAALACVQSVAFLCSVKYGHGEFLTLATIVKSRPKPVLVPMESLSGSYLPVMSYYDRGVPILSEGELFKMNGEGDINLGADRSVVLVGFAFEDEARMPSPRFYILNKVYELHLFGRAVTVEPDSEHFFMINRIRIAKRGKLTDFGVRCAGSAPTLVVSALASGAAIPMTKRGIDFRSETK